ncbi:MAG: efflux RND transporter permease subunit [Flavobacteriales bacterium]|nr:efflux RND transporter permease subunit [Flavobacteriales bacterium]
MVKFLINRPVAVMMSFLAAIILGVITYFTLPMSLLPDIAIPEITVQITSDGTSARQLENTAVTPIRRQLLQVAHLSSIESRARDGVAIIRMRFDYGTNTDYTFIEVNEKIDMAMGSLTGIDRPRVIKASATDLPVFNINMTLKSDAKYEPTDREKFLELSEFASSVIKRRIEQQPAVAMVDVTGVEKQEISIVPDQNKMTQAGITIADLENMLKDNNVEPGNMSVKDGYYEYNIRFSSVLTTVKDVENISFKKEGRLYFLSDIAKVQIVPEKPSGYSYFKGKRAIIFSVIKQADASMDDLKKASSDVLDAFKEQYPNVDFEISQNQTELLDYTMSNLQSNLWLGFVLICIVAILFFKDMRTPTVISLGVVVSLVVSMLFFYLFKVSLNIISISGLVLALGMMIDSSIIVTDNISQYREKDGLLDSACIRGTNEIIRPLLSSILTTIAVFVPLVFISGIAGALFYDQAVSISLGLGVSYIVGIVFLPVAYRIIYGSKKVSKIKMPKWLAMVFDKVDSIGKWRLYDRGFDFVFHHRKWVAVGLILVFPVIYILFSVVEKRKMPFIDHSESIVNIEWNENIHVKENAARVVDILKKIDGKTEQNVALVGEQQFILGGTQQFTSSEGQLYLRAENTAAVTALEKEVCAYVDSLFPKARVTVSQPENIFEKIFGSSEAEFTAAIKKKRGDMSESLDEVLTFTDSLAKKTGGKTDISLANQVDISVNNTALTMYGVTYSAVLNTIKTLFGENSVTTLRSNQQYLPMVIAWNEKGIGEMLSQAMVTSSSGKQLPLLSFINVSTGLDFKTISANKDGEYIPINYSNVKDHDALSAQIQRAVNDTNVYDVSFSGSVFSNRVLFKEMMVVLLISVLLLYFILSAQFESLSQPLIVLLELPIDIGASIFTLWIFGNSINVMSVIGIIVACGIVINDSILKLDVINTLRRDGMPIIEAIHTAGHRRLRAIVMTSLTTIFALLPMLFGRDMGSELQAPLSLSLIGGMVVGTLVSLYIIPLVYWFIYRNHENIGEVKRRVLADKKE